MKTSIFKSRKFWLLVVDVVISATSYFVGKYVAPNASQDILWMIGLLQPVFVALITAIATEDAAFLSTQ